MLGSIAITNWRTEDRVGGVQSLIDKGKSSQAHESVPNESSRSYETNGNNNANKSVDNAGVWSSSNAKPLFNSLAGFALEVGDRLLINGEEVIFKGWVDQSQTAIEVKAIADNSSEVRKIRAKEIRSLARSQDIANNIPSSTKQETSQSGDTKVDAAANTVVNEQAHTASENQNSGDRANLDEKSSNNSDLLEEPPHIEESPEIPKEPEYNAWEVWTYLERQRVKTLKLINTFHAEWEANRFVREAERSTPPNLRVHYEIRPVLLDEAELNGSYQNVENSHKSQDNPPEREEEDYADAIDVEVII
ncbi:hypothetical protein [Pseudanabaena sp. ABRG5-3]|uniref:hypothetical protein n=1 Tax=Pseudanabaena sp. ABRG5-3 TaxID=685565 RepID=UPI000DC73367|nr:hypothetical protein [Pseudanabaena sp. ABRG5-3]BBC23343.1 hypothetical protein ABRG53_1086 [Pseudanabaena sp. ABRG5-3]